MKLPRRILITGGAGLIGSHVAEQLVDAGHDVTIYDNFSIGRAENVSHLTARDRVRVVHGDILEPSPLRQAVAASEYVFHLAAALGVATVVRDPLRVIMTNVRGTENVLAACADLGRGALIASTSEVYGKNPSVPFREDADLVMGPTTVRRWAYAMAKALDEHLALAHHRRQGFPVTVVRYFNSYGPRSHAGADGHVVARFVEQALRGDPITVYGDGTQSRCFTYVEDTARATILAASSAGAVGEVLNIGSDHEMTIGELARRVVELAGSRSPIALVPFADVYGEGFEETRRRVPDLRKARRLLRFEAQVDLDTGLRRTLAWYRLAAERSAVQSSPAT